MTTLSETAVDKPLPSDPDQPADDRVGAAWSRRRFAAHAAVAGLIVAVMMHLRWGYGSGDGDHWVLALLGMHWANPQWFANDWAMLSAPQPHWFFDVITWFGAETGTLGGVYFLYWLISLAVFGSATALLARRWTPQRSWLAVVAFSILVGVAPYWFLGNISSMFPIAVPGILGAYLIYLMVAALLTERHRVAAIAGMVAAVIHVQQGLLGVALMMAVALVVFLRKRRIDRWLVLSSVVAVVICLVELRIRPVAGHTADFAEACRELIPYHCDANTWRLRDVLSASAMLFGFTSLTLLYLRRDLWLRAFLMLGVPSIALIVSVGLDKFDVPVLGELSQGLYVNRLAVILFPFGFWGILAPFLTKVSGRMAIAASGWLVVLSALAAGQQAWGTQTFELFQSQRKIVLAVVLGIGYLIAAFFVFQRVRAGRLQARPVVLAGVLVAIVISFGFQIGLDQPGKAFRQHVLGFTVNFVPDPGEREWGAQVERIVPPGEQILIPILSEEIRLVSRRAVVVDCKYGPYGGQPWQEYKERIGSLGGFEECRKWRHVSKDYTAAHMTQQARRWGANYMVVDQSGYGRLDDLVRREGWTVLMTPRNPDAAASEPRWQTYYLLKAPWA